MTKYYTIQQLSQKLNLPKPTLRFWEKELDGLIVPYRTNGGQRRYTAENLQVIEEVKKLQKKGLSLLEIKERLSQPEEINALPVKLKSIDLLGDRIADVVKQEVFKFLSRNDVS